MPGGLRNMRMKSNSRSDGADGLKNVVHRHFPLLVFRDPSAAASTDANSFERTELGARVGKAILAVDAKFSMCGYRHNQQCG